jgi:hypothetical protein
MNAIRSTMCAAVIYAIIPVVANANILIEPPDRPTQSLFLIREPADRDDEDDTDQSFSEKVIFSTQIDNIGRRTVGVLIDRLRQGAATVAIDNGANDEVIGMGSSIVSTDFLLSMGAWLFVSERESTRWRAASRRYLLPVPDDIEAGESVVFRTRIVGPAIGGQVPFSTSDGSTQAAVLNKALSKTLLDVVALPLFKKVMKGIDKTDERLNGIFETISDGVEWAYQLSEAEGPTDVISFIIDEVLKSDALTSYLEARSADSRGYLAALSGVESFQAIFDNPAADIADPFHALSDLAEAAWLDEYNITVTRPRIDNLAPKDPSKKQSRMVAGDVLVITGIGFDADIRGNNLVYFTQSNANDMDVLTLLVDTATITVIDEAAIELPLPAGVVPGPMEVMVDGLISNQVIFGDDFEAIVEITEPIDNASVSSGVYSVLARVRDAPDRFPAELTAGWWYEIDETRFPSRTLTSIEMRFPLDADSLTGGAHTIVVGVEFTGYPVITDTIRVRKNLDYNTYTFHGSAKIQMSQDAFPTGINMTWLKQGAFDGTTFHSVWDSTWSASDTSSIHSFRRVVFSATVNPNLETLKSFSIYDSSASYSILTPWARVYVKSLQGGTIPRSTTETRGPGYYTTRGEAACDFISAAYRHDFVIDTLGALFFENLSERYWCEANAGVVEVLFEKQ